MKKRWLKTVAAAVFCLAGSSLIQVQAAEQTGSYWSESNAPVIYGATAVTIPVGTDFSEEDTRFRAFAKDFEDGDLSHEMQVTENTVNAEQPGTYVVKYSVTDSHNNTVTAQVPVTVLAQADADIIVQRTMYTTPSVWNMDLAGTNRCNKGDRQHLGIFLPADSSMEIRLLEGADSLTIECFNDDMYRERSRYRGGSFYNFTAAKGGDWVNISNVVKVKADGSTLTQQDNEADLEGLQEESFDSVPFVATPVMNKGAALGQTVKIEVKYGSDVKALKYYLHGDDETEFRNKWNADRDSFGVMESEEMTILLPYDDLARTTNYFSQPNKGFSTLDEFFQYWHRIVNKMDYMLGLEFDPEDPIDQNVRTRYFVKVNWNGWGMAYYWNTHVAYNNYGQSEGRSMANFFAVDWCGIHEFGHGYQGHLGGGGGNMIMGEVGNNILGYYIQQNKELYPYEESWIGSFTEREDYFHSNRLETGEWIDRPDTQLYAIVNLFDYLEKEDTYRKLFQWYRRQREAGRQLEQGDAFAEGLAATSNVNVVPYFEAWGIEVSEESRDRIFEMQLPTFSMLGDMVGEDSRNAIMEEQDIAEKYEIVSREVYGGQTGSCTVKLVIDDESALLGKKIRLTDGDTVWKEAVVNGTVIEMEDVPVGVYNLQMPVSNSYTSNMEFVTIKEGANTEVILTYESLLAKKMTAGASAIQVQGIAHGVPLMTITFADHYQKAKVTFGSGNTGSEATYVKFLDPQNNVLKEEKVTGSGSYNFNTSQGSYEQPLQPGCVIEVHHPHKHRVQVFSSVTGQPVELLLPTEDTTRYVVYENGIRKEGMTEAEAEDALYPEFMESLKQKIDDFLAEASEEELENPYANRREKEEILIAYHSLKEADQEEYHGLVENIRTEVAEQAAKPVFSLAAGTYTEAQKVTISTETAGAVIYYTMDGTEPTTESTVYGGEEITITETTTLKAVAKRPEGSVSETAEAVYTINIPAGPSDDPVDPDNDPTDPSDPSDPSDPDSNPTDPSDKPETPFPFTDIAQDNGWKHTNVKYVWEKGIMNGISGTTLFDPDGTLTRGMFATVLYRMAGSPEVDFSLNKFSDITDPKQWYTNAVIWANQSGIVDGYTDGSYGVNDPVTRQQIAKMLNLYGKKMEYAVDGRADLSSFTDPEEVSGWAVEFMQWAVHAGMISGKPNGDGTFRMDPNGKATRAECAKMLTMFMENIQ